MKRDEVRQLLDRLHAAQQRVTSEVLDVASFESLTYYGNHRSRTGPLRMSGASSFQA
jgi:hypothetical protein